MAVPEFVLFGLLAALGWGAGDFLGAQAGRKTNPHNALFWTFLILSGLWLAFGLSTGNLKPLTIEGYLLALAVGLFFLIGDFLFLKTTQKGRVAIAAPYLALASVVVVVLGIALLGGGLRGFLLHPH